MKKAKVDGRTARFSNSPKRIRRGVYIKKRHSNILDQIILAQKMADGKSSPEVLEHAIELLADHHKSLTHQ